MSEWIWLAVAAVAVQLSCSKTDTAAPATPPDATTPADSTPDVDTRAPDADSGATGVPDISVDTPLDAAPDTFEERSAETSDVVDEADADAFGDANDVSTDSSDDMIVDVGLDQTDAEGGPDGNPCGIASPPQLPVAPSDPSQQIECTSSKPCPTGYECIGGGCDDFWHCIQHVDAPSEHPCSAEPADYCGCDGVTFTAVLVCPNRPYQRAGACEDGFSCDPAMLRCSSPEPPCSEGQVPSVVDGRYGQCVPIHFCRCQFVFECPHREKYTCDPLATRCTTLPVGPDR